MINYENLVRDLIIEHTKVTSKENDILAKKIAERINEVRNVVYEIGRWHDKSDKLKEKHKKELEDLKKELEVIKSNCKHYCQSFNPDPCGGRDSYYSCNHCGKEL
jgi:phage/plasmid-associated DNA primase